MRWRILLAVHQFPPEFSAGTETLALRTAQDLQRRGHTVLVLTVAVTRQNRLGACGEWKDEIYADVPVRRLYMPPNGLLPPRPISSTYHRPELKPCLESVLADFQPDLVHAFHLRRLTLALADGVRSRGIPLVLTLTDYWLGCPTGQLLLPDHGFCSGPDRYGANCARHLAGRVLPFLNSTPRLLWVLFMRLGLLPGLSHRLVAMQNLMRHAQSVLVPSRQMEVVFRGMGFDQVPLRVCPYGISLTGLDQAPCLGPWVMEERPLVVGFIGSLVPAKGAHVLIHALNRLACTSHPKHLRVIVAIYGSTSDDPVYVQLLQQAAAVLAHQRPSWSLEMCGTFPGDSIFSVLRRHDLLVVPSLWVENSPLIVLQALAAKVPLLASDVEGIRMHIEPGLDGLLFPPGDDEALADILNGLIREPIRLEELRHHHAPVRSLAAYVDDLEGHYGSALGGGG